MLPAVLGVVLCGWAGAPADPPAAPPPRPAARPRLVAQLGHNWSEVEAAVSGDGRWLLTGDVNHVAILWEVASGKAVRRFNLDASVTAVGIADDGGTVITVCAGKDGTQTARVWDAGTGEERRRFAGAQVMCSLNARWVVTFAAAAGKDVKLFDAATGREVGGARWARPEGVECVDLSDDGRRAVLGLKDGAVVLDLRGAGKAAVPLAGVSGRVRSVAFAGDSRAVAATGPDGTVRVCEAETGKEIRCLKPERPAGRVVPTGDGQRVLVTVPPPEPNADKLPTESVLFSTKTGEPGRRFEGIAAAVAADGRWVLTCSEHDRKDSSPELRLWDAATGKERARFRGSVVGGFAVALSPSARWAVTYDDGRVCLWDGTTGREVRRVKLDGASGRPKGLAVSDDGSRVWAGPGCWDGVTGKPVFAVPAEKEGVTGWGWTALSADGRRVTLLGAAAGEAGGRVASVREADTGKELFRVSGRTVAIDGGGRWVMAVDPDGVGRVHDAAGKELRRVRVPKRAAGAVEPPAGGDLFLLRTGPPAERFADRSVAVRSAADGGSVGEVRWFGQPWPDNVDVSPDGRRVLALDGLGNLRLWDAKTLAEVGPGARRSFHLDHSGFSPGGRWLIAGEDRGAAAVIDPGTNREVCSVYSFADGTWAVVDPAGRYDASNGGDVDGLHWVVGREVIALKQLKERYYDPGLLAKLLGYSKEPLRDVAVLTDVKLHPAVAADPPGKGASTATVKLTNRGGGIGKVQVFVNGKELLADARGPKPDPAADAATLAVDLSAAANLIPGEPNHVEVVAFNADGYLSGRGMTFRWTPDGPAEEHKPELYAVVCGVAHYADEALNLRYPAKDAEDFAAALDLAGKRLFGADKVHLTLLTTSDAPGAKPPTKENLRAAFAAARKARPGDVLVVYLAGHGVGLRRGADVYVYPTRDARTLDPQALADPAVLARDAVTSDELTEWVKAVPALKQVLVLDTCAAGAAATKLTEKRDVSGDQVRALDRLKDRTGFHVLMGCAADRVSYEATRYAQGLLTYALLEGMKGAALREGEYVEVDKLFGHAVDRVPGLAGNVGGVQRPLVAAPRGSSFPIGRLTADDKAKVRLAPDKPLVLRPTLWNRDEDDDDLKLGPLLARKLADASRPAARGAEAGLVYLPEDDFPGAVRPTGSYTVAGEKVSVRLLLKRDGKTVAKVEVEGKKGDLPGLAAELAKKVTEAAGGVE